MITELRSALNTRWKALEPRQRWWLVIVAIALLALAIYRGLWNPWQRSLERLSVEVPEARAQLAWMRAALPRLQALRAAASRRPAAAIAPGVSLLEAVEQTLAAHRPLAEQIRSEPLGTNAVRVTFDKVVFEELLAWLAELGQQEAVRLETLDVERTPSPGRVHASLVLRRS